MKVSYEFSNSKDRLNRRDHGISLARAMEFDFNAAIVDIDDALDYGEERWSAIGFLAGNLYVMIFLFITESHLRVISLRKADTSEERKYVEH